MISKYKKGIKVEGLCVLFPEKLGKVKGKQDLKAGAHLLSLSPPKLKYEPESTEYRFNSYSKVIATKNLSFPWKDISGELSNASVKKILNDSINSDIVSVKAKVVSKSDVYTVYSHRMKSQFDGRYSSNTLGGHD